jgi:hypothetical protein
MTTKDLIEDLMDFSCYGVLSHAFILEAIRKYSEQVCAADDEIFKGSMIDGEAWKGCAKDINKKIERYLDEVTA